MQRLLKIFSKRPEKETFRNTDFLEAYKFLNCWFEQVARSARGIDWSKTLHAVLLKTCKIFVRRRVQFATDESKRSSGHGHELGKKSVLCSVLALLINAIHRAVVVP